MDDFFASPDRSSLWRDMADNAANAAPLWPDAETLRQMVEAPWRTFWAPPNDTQRADIKRLVLGMQARHTQHPQTPKGVWSGG